MKLAPTQLEVHLKRGLAPVYLIAGDEPLLVREACDLVRRHAQEQGYREREVMEVGRDFDWGRLYEAANAPGLFGDRRLLELRLGEAKPGDAGGKALAAYAQRPADDAVLLIIAGKLDAQAQRTRWVQALDQCGVVAQVWPVEARRLPEWLRERMRAQGLQPDEAAVALLAERVEGNLLAATQEIEKLVLLHGSGPVGAGQVAAAVADSARFDIYGLVDAALAGEAAHVARMIAGLRAEGVAETLVLWALARELRSLEAMSRACSLGESVERALAAQRVWDKRKALVRRGLSRHGLGFWRDMLGWAGIIDRMIKGLQPGAPWDELLQLGLCIAGLSYLPRSMS